MVANKNSAPDQRWDTETLPAQLRVVPYPPARATHDHLFEFQSKNGGWRINGVGWSDGPEARVLAKPQRGAIEVWDLKNTAGGWTHPIHIHLVCFNHLRAEYNSTYRFVRSTFKLLAVLEAIGLCWSMRV